MSNAPKAELSFLAPVPDRAVPKGAIVLLGVVMVLVGYGLWYLHTEHARRLAEAIPNVPATLAPLALPPKPVTPPAAKPAAAVEVVPKPTAPATTTEPVTTAPVSTSPAPTAAAAAAPATPPATPASVAAAPAPAVAQATVATTATAPPDNGQVIVATADSWIEVRDATGNILFSKVLHAGDSWPVPDEAGLTMTTGNAGGTEIADNGKDGAPLGAVGAVLHDYALTPQAAKPAAPDATN